MAAAENRIAPTTHTGELMEIARKAMATHPRDRYPSVRDFQAAVRDYQAHTESLHLTEEARKDLDRARATDIYDDYAQAVYACRQALDLWAENREAAALLVEARAAYAGSALARGDLDLADSVLDPDEPAHADLAARIAGRRRERTRRERRVRVLTRVAQGLAIGVIVILAVATAWISREYLRAERSEREAVDARNQALASLEVAEDERARAEAARVTAEAAREAEREQRLLAQAAEERARAEEARALEAEQQALAALEAVVRARSAEEAARARAEAAEMMAEQAQEELSRSGLLRDVTWWTFDAAEAAERQAAAAARTGLPARRSVSLPGGEALRFALVPAGAFVMGSPADEPNRAGGEHLHRVTITRPFYMAVGELTVAEAAAALGSPGGEGAGGGAGAGGVEPADGRGGGPEVAAPDGGTPAGDLPRTDISWDEVTTELLPALNRHAPDGFRFRLPTEAEWEYACRAGTATSFYTGEGAEAMSRAGWYLFNSDRKIHPAGRKLPNPWGLRDLHGNIAEFCADGFLPAFYLESPTDDPLARTDEPRRVVRGGSCLNLAEHCRSAYRSWAHRENRYKFLGVRLVLEPLGIAPDPAASAEPAAAPAE
jgi:formylglycine-generating enzyme required for sulfatase activity